MSRHFLPSSRVLIPGALFCSAISLPRVARADETTLLNSQMKLPVSPLESKSDVAVKPITQSEFADAATGQINFLKELRAWRNTLRGNGARRDWGLSLLGREKLALSLGNVAPQSLGGGAGLVAKWQRVEIGSTAQPKSINEAIAGFDSVLSGQDVKAQNPTQLNWLRAQLVASKQAQVEVMAARATRDFAATDARWRAGDFQSATAKFQLPAKWSLSGDFSRAAVEGSTDKTLAAQEGDAASAWGFAASGPIAHPFGVASASANWRQTETGYVAPTSESGAVGTGNGALTLAQELKIGHLSGNLKFGAATNRRAEAETALAGQQLGQDTAQSTAQLRLAVTPNLSVTGNGNWNTSAATRALIDQNRADDANANASASGLTPTQARDLSRQLAGDLGVQWNFSKALSLAVSLGLSSQDSHSESGELSTQSAQNDEMRRALEVRSKSGANDLRLRFSQRTRRNALATTNLNQNASAPVSQWRLEAARPLIAGMRVKTILDFASNAAQNQSARRIEAQFQLARAARFDARYREGNLAPGLMSDEWSSVFAATNSAPKQVSARFGLGSATTGAGLGLSLEMVRNQGVLPDSYRIGVQFK